jgi:hypothetical protein
LSLDKYYVNATTMSDSDHKRKPEPSADRSSAHAAKRRKVAKQEEQLSELLKQLEVALESITVILDSTKERFTLQPS